MSRRITVGLLLTLLVLAGLSWGQSYTVCPQNCSYSSIQEAINDAFPGDTITVGPGTYKEHLKLAGLGVRFPQGGACHVDVDHCGRNIRMSQESL